LPPIPQSLVQTENRASVGTYIVYWERIFHPTVDGIVASAHPREALDVGLSQILIGRYLAIWVNEAGDARPLISGGSSAGMHRTRAIWK
jgi:hypothetical protein